MAIHQEISIRSNPEKVYNVLTTSLSFSEFSNAPAEISQDEGGKFSCFDGQITGRNIELIPPNLIIQAWRVKAWPDSTYSIVRFTLSGSNELTNLTLDHSGYPDEAAEHLEGGWHKMYWDPLKAYCE